MLLGKTDLIDTLSLAADLTLDESRRAVDALFGLGGVFSLVLREGGRVRIVDFGTFKIRHRPARSGFNPATGEPIDIPAKDFPVFRAARNFRKYVRRKVEDD